MLLFSCSSFLFSFRSSVQGAFWMLHLPSGYWSSPCSHLTPRYILSFLLGCGRYCQSLVSDLLFLTLSNSYTPQITVQTFHELSTFIFVKQTTDNYLIWKKQLQSIMEGQDIESHIFNEFPYILPVEIK